MNRKGYTLVELVVVIFLVGVMLFIAVPSMRHVLLSDPLPAAAKKMVALAKELRMDAVREQVDFVFHVDLNRNSFWTYSVDMTPEKRDERRKQAFVLADGIKITDISHVGEAKQSDGEAWVVFYKNGVVQPTVIHMGKEQEAVTVILEPFLRDVKMFDRYVEYPGDGDKN